MSCFGKPKQPWVLEYHATVGGMLKHKARGRWLCRGCQAWTPFLVDEYLERVGPNYSLWNEISVCDCGAPRSLHVSPAESTPYRPNIDPYLWITPEIGYGRDPEAWFTIQWMA